MSKIHELAIRFIKAQKLTDVKRGNEVKSIMSEAKIHGLSPNEILSYSMQNQGKLLSETSSSNSDATTLTQFKDWYLRNVSTTVNDGPFYESLNEHVKKVKNFDFYG